MRCERRKYATGNAAVAIGFSRAKNCIGFVHHDDDGSQRANREQNPHLLLLSVADPFGAELAHFHYRQTTLAGEAIDEERFADADSPGHQHAALDNIRFSIAKQPGQLPQPTFGSYVRRDAIQSDSRLGIFESDQALAVLFNKPLFAGGYQQIGRASCRERV